MDAQKALLFIDYANINRTAYETKKELDYGHLKTYITRDKELLDAFCYVPIDPRCEHKLDKKIDELQHAGYFVTTKIGTCAGVSYKCNMDIEMAIDIVRMSYVVRPNLIILATGDGDFIPVINELRKMGISAEVAAFKSAMSKQLYLKASRLIDLDKYYDEYARKNHYKAKPNGICLT